MSTNTSNGSSSQQNMTSLTCESLYTFFPVQISTVVVLSIILLSSLVGNTLVTIVVYKRKELRKTVNYFILNMAVSDLVFPLISIPINLANSVGPIYWKWPIGGTAGLILCKLTHFLTAVSLTVSIESLVWISIDRFVAVVFPMKLHSISSRFRAFAIASTWIVAVMINSIELHASDLEEDSGTITCRSGLLLKTLAYEYARVVLVYIAPLTVITILYCAIAVTLRRQAKVLRCAAVNDNDQRKRKAIKMSICVVVAFYSLFLPFITALLSMETAVAKSCLSYEALWLCASLTVSLSSTSNPIILFTFVESYRRGLREIINSCQNKRLNSENMDKREQEQITLRHIRVIPEVAENLAFNET